MDRFEQRRDKLRKGLRGAEVNGLLVTNFQNVTYLTGFTGDDSYLLLTDTAALVLSDARYTTQLEEECPGLDLSIRKPGVAMPDAVSRAVLSAKLSRLGVESASMTMALHAQLHEKLPKVDLISTSGLVEGLREIKDAEEIEEIRRAIWYAEKGFAVLRATLSPDRTEREVAYELENQLRKFGATGCSFPPIIAVGARSALPHARPTDQKIGEGDFVLVDWGAQGRLYKSDLTRILTTGRISPKLERVYGVVLKAQLSAIDAIRPGVTAAEVDQVARQSIAEAGFGARFGHSLGHGIGLDIHEAPRLGANQNRPLRPGMVVTVEPGVYLPGWGGVRIEDDVLVTKNGHEVLTSVPKSLEDTLVR